MRTLIYPLWPILVIGALLLAVLLNQQANKLLRHRFELTRLLILWYVLLLYGGRLLVALLGGEWWPW